MPKQKTPETYDEYLGVALMNAARVVGRTQADLADAVGLSERTFSRRMKGDPGFTVKELETLARLVGAKPGQLMQDALENYGGVEKLLSEAQVRTYVPTTDAEVLDILDHRSRGEGVSNNQKAALRGRKDRVEE